MSGPLVAASPLPRSAVPSLKYRGSCPRYVVSGPPMLPLSARGRQLEDFGQVPIQPIFWLRPRWLWLGARIAQVGGRPLRPANLGRCPDSAGSSAVVRQDAHAAV